MDLNKRAMEHLGREQLYGYGAIDESQWQEQATNTNCQKHTNGPNSRENSTSPMPTARTGGFTTRRTSGADDGYIRQKEEWAKEKFLRDRQTKVKVVKPTSLMSFKLLKEAENALLTKQAFNVLGEETLHRLSCVTLNNLGCFYKKLNFSNVALEYFMQVLALEQLLKVDTISLVSTMLNICANLSKQGKHMDALSYSKRSIMYLKREMMEDGFSPKSRGQKSQRVMSANFWTTLQIAYYNMGVEEEYLGKLSDALVSLEKAKLISEMHLQNPNDAMTQIIDKNIQEISQKKAIRDRIHA